MHGNFPEHEQNFVGDAQHQAIDVVIEEVEVPRTVTFAISASLLVTWRQESQHNLSSGPGLQDDTIRH